MNQPLRVLESRRLRLQKVLDSEKSQEERNSMGQFATPPPLAAEMLKYAKTLFNAEGKVRFLDPALGTGSFYSAMLKVFGRKVVDDALGFEIDASYGGKAKELWSSLGLRVVIEDFTRADPPSAPDSKPNLLICNPPYVRHHHISRSEKERLQTLAYERTGIHVNGLTGLYGYFLLLCHSWMADKSVAGWLIPSEFMDVKYGRQLQEYLLKSVRLVRVHRFDPVDVQFSDALVSSSVIWFRNEPPQDSDEIEFTYGGFLLKPKIRRTLKNSDVAITTKWVKLFRPSPESKSEHARISDLFRIKRGLATGANSFFILEPKVAAEHAIPDQFLVPILPGPRFLADDEVLADNDGNPLLEKSMFLLSCDLPEKVVRARHPNLWKYLQRGVKKGINEGYLCRNRNPWYSQEKRSPTPFLCTYMGRKRNGSGQSFRFILNHSQAVANNTYLMLYPTEPLGSLLLEKPELVTQVWESLKRIPQEVLQSEGRVYGGGLHKIEPKELGMAPADEIAKMLESMWQEY